MGTVHAAPSYKQARQMYDEAPIKGVGVIVRSRIDPKILLITERATDRSRFKVAGMRSCILETAEEGEAPLDTLRRAMSEEAPGVYWAFPREQGFYRVVEDPPHVVLVYVVDAVFLGLPIYSTSSDIGDPQWVDPKESLNQWLRGGVREILQDYTQGAVRVCCMECATPPLSPP